jgi:AcrR family transcriptional regulator
MQNDVTAPVAGSIGSVDGGAGGLVVEQIAARAVAARNAGYVEEVRRLINAGLVVMQRVGSRSSPRVADVVAEAGMSNEAFYRHFGGKDEFVTAIIDAGTEQLEAHLRQRMQRAEEPAAEIGAWVEAMMQRAVDPQTAETIRVVLWNGYRVNDDSRRRGASRERLAELLVDPIRALGSDDAERDALLVCYACMLRMEEFLWRRTAPTDADIAHVASFCLRAVGGAR